MSESSTGSGCAKVILAGAFGSAFLAIVLYNMSQRGAGPDEIAGAVFVVVLVVVFFLAKSLLSPRRLFHRGRQLSDYEAVAERVQRELLPGDAGLFWAGLCLPSHYASHQFLVAGVQGSGKTLTIHMLMKSALPLIGQGRGHRAIIYDYKKDSLAILAGMGLYRPGEQAARVFILHPFDARGCAWDIAADITNEVLANAIVEVLFPLEKNSAQPFFGIAANALCAGVMTAFAYHAPGNWQLRDVALAMQSKEALRTIFLSCPHTAPLVEQYLDIHEWPSVFATIANKMRLFKPIAAAWAHAAIRISLTQWDREEWILLLGTDQTMAPQLDALNRVLLQRAAQIALNHDDHSAKGRCTWAFLDECQVARFEAKTIHDLLSGGRSKGLVTVLGFQDVQGLRSVYGEKEADAMIAQCSLKALLRMDGEKSAKWAAELVGQYDQEEYQKSWSTGRQGNTTSTSIHRVQRDAILPSEFMQLRTPDFQTNRPFDGVYLTRMGGVHRLALEPNFMLKHALPPADHSVPGFVPRPPEELELAPGTEADLHRLHIDLPPADRVEPSIPRPARTAPNLQAVKRISLAPSHARRAE